MNLVMISSLASKCQDFKVGMAFFQPFYEMKLKTSKFKVLAFWSQWRYHNQIQITRSLYNKLPSLSHFHPGLWNIGILHYKQAKLRKHLQHSVLRYVVWLVRTYNTRTCYESNWPFLFLVVERSRGAKGLTNS